MKKSNVNALLIYGAELIAGVCIGYKFIRKRAEKKAYDKGVSDATVYWQGRQDALDGIIEDLNHMRETND